MTCFSFPRLLLAGAVLLMLSATAKPALLLSDIPDLTPLTPYAAFGPNINLNLATVDGNTGVSAGGKITISGPSSILGALNLDNGVTKSISGKVTGGIFTPVNLAAAQALVLSASTTLRNFAPDYNLGDVKTAQTFASTGQVTIIDMKSLTLGGSNNITLTGGANDYFVLNIAGNVALTGSSIVGAGSIDPSHILINLYDNSGNLGTAAHINNVLNGTVLIPYDNVTFHGMNGAVWAGQGQVTLMSGAVLNNIPFVPEPSTISLIVAGAIGGLAARRRLLGKKS